MDPGAVVGFDTRHVVISVSTAEFEHAGVTYMGISPQSPIYKAMKGLEKGDSFMFHGKEVVLDEVF